MRKGMSVIGAYSHFLYREIYQQQRDEQYCVSERRGIVFWRKSGCGNTWIESCRNRERKIGRRNLKVEAMWPDLSRPSTVEMAAINDSEQLDQILVHAHQNSEPILIDWYFFSLNNER